MNFWGVEVKAGEPLKVVPEESHVIHLSQACLGEAKKGGDQGVIYVKTGDHKLVLGHVSSEKFPQLFFDLVFEQEFELSHNLKSGSVHFCGYDTFVGGDEEDSSDSEYGSSDEEMPMNFAIPAPSKPNAVKPQSSDKQKVKIEEPSKDDEDSSDSEDVSDDAMGFDVGSDEDLDEESSEEDSSDDEETPTPKKSSKKRSIESASKTPVPAKKAKQVTPQKTDGKKGAHTATPHPAKKSGKTPATGDKAKPETPGSHPCKSCSKSFSSDGALQSHSKAKHSAK